MRPAPCVLPRSSSTACPTSPKRIGSARAGISGARSCSGYVEAQPVGWVEAAGRYAPSATASLHPALISHEGAQQVTGGDVPQFERVVMTSREHGPAVRRKCDRYDVGLMPVEGAQQPAR